MLTTKRMKLDTGSLGSFSLKHFILLSLKTVTLLERECRFEAQTHLEIKKNNE